ncbi:MAG: hypothetical protein N2652_03900 [Kiritimatiellae bacterium]|nr:hypothetical protein [Kiritimatiellia bacterium]
MSTSPWISLLAAAVVVGLCFVGLGIGVLAGRRRRIGACSCEFDPDAARAGRCCDPSRSCRTAER